MNGFGAIGHPLEKNSPDQYFTLNINFNRQLILDFNIKL